MQSQQTCYAGSDHLVTTEDARDDKGERMAVECCKVVDGAVLHSGNENSQFYSLLYGDFIEEEKVTRWMIKRGRLPVVFQEIPWTEREACPY